MNQHADTNEQDVDSSENGDAADMMMIGYLCTVVIVFLSSGISTVMRVIAEHAAQ